MDSVGHGHQRHLALFRTHLCAPVWVLFTCVYLWECMSCTRVCCSVYTVVPVFALCVYLCAYMCLCLCICMYACVRCSDILCVRVLGQGNYSFFDAPFIWTSLHNMGANDGMKGDMRLLTHMVCLLCCVSALCVPCVLCILCSVCFVFCVFCILCVLWCVCLVLCVAVLCVSCFVCGCGVCLVLCCLVLCVSVMCMTCLVCV